MAKDVLDIKDNHENPINISGLELLNSEKKCKVCTMRHPYTLEYLRETIDAAVGSGIALTDISNWLKVNLNIDVSIVSISNHINKHALYVKRISPNVLKDLRIAGNRDIVMKKPTEIIAEGRQVDAYDAMQEIVDIGRDKILNGELKVDARMMISAANIIAKMDKESGFNKATREANKARFAQVKQPALVEGKVSDETAS